MTPKSLLRDPACVSPLGRAGRERLPRGHRRRGRRSREGAAPRAARAASSTTTCQKERQERGAYHVALVRLEQLYPFPGAELGERAGPLPADGRAGLGPRRSRATWARGGSSASASSTATSRPGRPNAAYAGRPESASPADRLAHGSRPGAEGDPEAGLWP